MSATLTITVLGCGASPGVPRIGNDWGACDPNEPRNRRRRCALLVERRENGSAPTRVLVDAGPDIREQLLDARVDTLDAVVCTHPHADHLHGIDDLRAFWQNTGIRVPVYADAQTERRLDEAFGYCFRALTPNSYPATLEHRLVAPGHGFGIEGDGGVVTVMPFRQLHGDIDSLGLRFGPLAYSSDLHDLPEESLPLLDGLDTWMVDALRYRPHPSHFSVDDALGWIARLKPERAVLTHLHGEVDYRTLAANVPENVSVAYDGMTLEFSV